MTMRRRTATAIPTPMPIFAPEARPELLPFEPPLFEPPLPELPLPEPLLLEPPLLEEGSLLDDPVRDAVALFPEPDFEPPCVAVPPLV